MRHPYFSRYFHQGLFPQSIFNSLSIPSGSANRQTQRNENTRTSTECLCQLTISELGGACLCLCQELQVLPLPSKLLLRLLSILFVARGHDNSTPRRVMLKSRSQTLPRKKRNFISTSVGTVTVPTATSFKRSRSIRCLLAAGYVHQTKNRLYKTGLFSRNRSHISG